MQVIVQLPGAIEREFQHADADLCTAGVLTITREGCADVAYRHGQWIAVAAYYQGHPFYWFSA